MCVCVSVAVFVGVQVTEILDKSPVWKEYRDQRHDLFITDTNIAGYLTGQCQHVLPHGGAGGARLLISL